MEEYINVMIAPKIRGDGGWVEFVSFKNNTLSLLFRAECSKCIILDRCCTWIADCIRQDLNLHVQVIPVRKKPFFWDEA